MKHNDNNGRDDNFQKLKRAADMLDEVRDCAESAREMENAQRNDSLQENRALAEMNTHLLTNAISLIETAQSFITMAATNMTADTQDAEAHERVAILLQNFMNEVLRENGFGILRSTMLAQQAKNLVESYSSESCATLTTAQKDMARAQAMCISMTPKMRLS